MPRRLVRRSPVDDRVALMAAIVIAGASLGSGNTSARATQAAMSSSSNITSVPGIAVGHFTRPERPTGCTVILVEGGAVGAVEVRGGAPGTVETDLLAPENTVEQVHAIFLAGGSAFGLDTRSGVVRYLEEKKIGFRTGAGPVPIVPGAILYDLGIGDRPDIRPGADCGYNAARAAARGEIAEGSVGAGAGATVGKLLGAGRAMKGGVGSAALTTTDGLIVGAIVVVNATGSVVDPRTGRPIAGMRTADGRALEDPFALVRRGADQRAPAREQTTIGVIATNARLTKSQTLKVVEMAHDGLARTIVPSHTPADGDTLFGLATGDLTREVSVGTIGALAAEAVADAIVRAVRTARGLPGYPAASEIR
jgi:L-aminopeptidase/D-esterase-like protein